MNRLAVPATMLASPVVLAFLLCVGCAPGDAGTLPADAPGPEMAAAQAAEVTHLELRISPLVDLYYEVRAQAAADDDPSPGHEDAVAAARFIQQSMGSFGGWGPLDSQVLAAADAQALVQGFGDLPDPYERHGRKMSIRDDAVRLATAFRKLLPDFEQVTWPDRKVALERRIADLEKNFMPVHRNALAFMMQSLGIPDPGISVPVFLVSAANPPGAMTYFLRGGAPASVVDIHVGGTDDLLIETILHESSHALDLASRGDDTAFTTLRALLEKRGLSPRDGAYRNVPHTLMFVQAAETVRRLFNPDHVAYGEATSLYARTGAIADVEGEIWPRYLDGAISRDEALNLIAERFAPQSGGD
ncbi:MAG: hypothetical protein ACE5HU_03365 [Acidobacteriota bacterium]